MATNNNPWVKNQSVDQIPTPGGSFLNESVASRYKNKEQGVKGLVSEPQTSLGVADKGEPPYLSCQM